MDGQANRVLGRSAGVIAGGDYVLNGFGYGVGGFEVHVVACGDDDLSAVGGELGELGLGALALGFEFGGRDVEIFGVAFGSGEDDERDVAEDALLRSVVHQGHGFGGPLLLVVFGVIEVGEAFSPELEAEFAGLRGACRRAGRVLRWRVRGSVWRLFVGWEEIFAGGGDGELAGIVADAAGVRAHGDALVFLDDVNEDHAGDLAWISGGVVADDSAAEGVADEDVGAGLVEGGESVVEFEVELGEGAGFGAGVAPSVAAAVVGADAGEFFYAPLDENPGEGEITEAVFDNDGVRTVAGAVDVEEVSAEIDQFARGLWLRECSCGDEREGQEFCGGGA